MPSIPKDPKNRKKPSPARKALDELEKRGEARKAREAGETGELPLTGAEREGSGEYLGEDLADDGAPSKSVAKRRRAQAGGGEMTVLEETGVETVEKPFLENDAPSSSTPTVSEQRRLRLEELAPMKLEKGKLDELAGIVDGANLNELVDLTSIERTFRLAAAMKRLHELVTDEALEDVMTLQNVSIGFRTDATPANQNRDLHNGYPVGVVKRVVIEALLSGLQVVGNQFNIISYNLYCTKNGFGALVRNFPGLEDLDLLPGIPRLQGEKGAICPMRLRYRRAGELLYYPVWRREEGEEAPPVAEIPCRVNRGQGADALLGKAERKLLARFYRFLCDGRLDVPEGDVEDVEISPGRPSSSSRSSRGGAPQGSRLTERLLSGKREATGGAS